MEVPENVKDATDASITAASHLQDMDQGVAAVLLKLAASIDDLILNDFMTKSDKFDNVSVPMYLRYAESLHLTPAARAKAAAAAGPKAGGKSAKLTQLQDGAASAQ